MSRIIKFPASHIKKGTHVYYPEMGERKVNAQIEAKLTYNGKHYLLYTPLELKGQGITFIKTCKASDLVNGSNNRRVGWNQYRVTHKAYDKLEQKYSISSERLLD